MSGYLNEYEQGFEEAREDAEAEIERLTVALKDAELVNADLRERIDTMARQELADIPEYVALERERERLRDIESAAREARRILRDPGLLWIGAAERLDEALDRADALQEPAPQDAEAGE